MKNIFLYLLIASGMLLADFTRDYSTDTVIDDQRALMWQDSEEVPMLIWKESLKYCEDLEFANHEDWRLPNKEELDSLVDIKRKLPAINKEFENTISYRYWSSTERSEKKAAWYVNFSYGQKDGYYKTKKSRVLCVRADI